MIQDLDYYRPIPGAPGYSVSREGEVIDEQGRPLRTQVQTPWGEVCLELTVHGTQMTKTPGEWAALAWASETPEQRARRLKLEKLRQRIAAAEAVVFKTKNPGETA